MRWAWLIAAVAACGKPPDPAPEDAGRPMPPAEADLIKQRPYAPLVPDAGMPDAGWPLMLVLHGYGGTGEQTMATLHLGDVAGRFAIVAPLGRLDSRKQRAWHPGPEHSPWWDVEYLTAIIHDMQRAHPIDPARVYVVGHSQGAHMAHRMGCDAANDVAAVISVAGQVAKAPSACVPARAVSVLQVHGDMDEAIGYGGDIQNNPPDPSVPSAHETVAVWARNDQCTGGLQPTGVRLDLSRTTDGGETVVDAYAGCPAGIAVELWTMEGVGHGPQATSAFAPALEGFLLAHPR